jgi:hypothetical protein
LKLIAPTESFLWTVYEWWTPIEFAPMHKCYTGTESYNSNFSQPRFRDHENSNKNHVAHIHINSYSLLMGLLVSVDEDQRLQTNKNCLLS